MQRYYPFSQFLRRRFGGPVHKVCIDAGFTCPNIDGTVATGGCTYCNNNSFSPNRRLHLAEVTRQIEQGMAHLERRFGATQFLAYFQSFSNTYAPLPELRELYTHALSYPGMVGLDVATRPDCIDVEKLDFLQELAADRLVLLEYGLQSSHDATLRLTNRGHDYACFVRAVEMTQGHGVYICAHVILGFPNESDNQMLQTADRLAQLPIDFIKIHDLHVVRGTALARTYEESPFPMRSSQEYIDLLCRFLERLPAEMGIQRLFSYTPPELLIAPRWNKDSTSLLRDIRAELERRNTWQGRLYSGIGDRGPGISRRSATRSIDSTETASPE